MVNTQKIANEFNKKLDAIATELNTGHKFKLMAHDGKTKQGRLIEGILRPVSNRVQSKGGTGNGVVNNRVVYVAEFVVPTGIDNKSAVLLEEVINKLVHDYDGYSYTEGTDVVVWDLQLGIPKDYAFRSGVGSSIPMAFTANVSFSDNGLINGVKEWTLDGVAIPYVNEGVILNKDGVVLSVMEAKTQQTIPTSQWKQYKFTIPYDKNSTVCTTLQNDILNGNFRKTYTLAYSDGVITYSTKVALYQTGDMSSRETGDATMMAVSFVDAGNKTYKDVNNNDVTYTIGLLNFPFDDQSENTLYFESQAAQQTYMNNAVLTASASYRDMTAPNLNTTLLTNVVYDASQGVQTYDINTLTNLNYATIKKTTTIITPASGNTPATTTTQNQYYYYWVTQCTQGADGILLLNLKLDTIQTYMFNPNLTIPDCMIERAHLNRWVDNGNNSVIFNANPNSPLFTMEDVKADNQRLIIRQKAYNKYDGSTPSTTAIDGWFERNVLGWKLVFLKSQGTENEATFGDKFYANITETTIALPNVSYNLKNSNNSISGIVRCLCIPVYKTDARIYVGQMGLRPNINESVEDWTAAPYADLSKWVVVDDEGLNGYKELNYDGARIIATKFVTESPFKLSDWVTVFTDAEDNEDIPYHISNNDDLYIMSMKGETDAGFDSDATNFFGSYNGITYFDYSSSPSPASLVFRDAPFFAVRTKSHSTNNQIDYSVGVFVVADTGYSQESFSIYTTLPQSFNIGTPYTLNRTGSFTAGNTEVTVVGLTQYNNAIFSMQITFTYNGHQSTVSFTDSLGYLKLGETRNIKHYLTGRKFYMGYSVMVDATSVRNDGTCDVYIILDNNDFLNNPTLITQATINYTYTITNTNICSSSTQKDKYLNPKIYSSNFHTLKLVSINGDNYDYDLQKINQSAIITQSNSSVNPDFGTEYFRIKGLDGVYIPETSENMTGVITQHDNYLPLSTNYYQEQLAQSKNYYLGKGWNIIGQGVLGAASGLLAGGNPVTAAVGLGAGVINGIVNTAMETSNMKATPDNIKNAGSSILLNASYTEAGNYIEEYEALPQQLETANDYMFMYGFKCGLIDSIANHIHTRKYFNYIKAQIGDIQGVPLTNEIRNDIKQRFANGVRFWDATTFATNGVQYDKENYELWLED